MRENTAMSKNKQLYHITTNLSGKNIRHDKIADRDYIVVPMVMIVEGVLNANQGPLYYPKEELEKFPEVWNNKPIVVYHPEINGKGVSCDPDILSTQQVGIINNTRFINNELKAEAWLEETRINKVDPRIAESIENNTMMELSTGLYLDYEKTPGVFNNIEYSGVAKNFKPDHLAILPDKVGACSIKDGAGFLRNELSFEVVKDQLNSIIRAAFNNNDAWVIDVYKNNFIFSSDNKLYKQDYTINKNKVSVSGLSAEVFRRYEYVVINNKKRIHTVYYDERVIMTDKEKMAIVDNLIKQKSGLWLEDDRDFLMAHNEEDLKYLVEKKMPEPIIKKEEKKEAKEETTDVTTNDSIGNKQTLVSNLKPTREITVEEYINNAPKAMKETLQQGLEAHKQVRAALINKIIANENNIFTAEELETKPIVDLKGLAALCKTDDGEVYNYSGQGSVCDNDNQQVLALPELDWSK